MAVVRSAGILLFRRQDGVWQVLIGHMGGPFWLGTARRSWTVPKGELLEDEDALVGARREFAEETGNPAPDGDYVELGEIMQANRKRVTVWAVEADLDPRTAVSNSFTLEWPKGSGHLQEFPEIDRFEWHDLHDARALLVTAQVCFLDRLQALIAA